MPARFPYITKRPLPKPYEFDIFVYFSDRFLALDKEEQARLLNGFNFKWFNFSGGPDGRSAGIGGASGRGRISSSGSRASLGSGFDDRLWEEFEEEGLSRQRACAGR